MVSNENRKLLDKIFNKYDTNGDGVLSLDELEEMVDNLPGNWTSVMKKDLISIVDSDADGEITPAEFESAFALICAEKKSDGQSSPLKKAEGGIPVEHSKTIMRKILRPENCNSSGIVEIGEVLKWIDLASLATSWKHAGGNSVTSRIDQIHFSPELPRLGDIVILNTKLIRVYGYKMEIVVKVSYNSKQSKEQKPLCTAYSVFVALDFDVPNISNNPPVFKPTPRSIPPLKLSTDEERKMYKLSVLHQAQRREKYLLMKKSKKTEGKHAAEGSKWKTTTTEIVLPQYANPYQTCFGGQQMAWLVDACVVCAGNLMSEGSIEDLRVSCIEEVFFKAPVFLGQMVEILAQPTRMCGEDSVEIEVTLFSTCRFTKKRTRCSQTFVTLKSKRGLQYKPATEGEKAREEESQNRWKLRLKQRVEDLAQSLNSM